MNMGDLVPMGHRLDNCFNEAIKQHAKFIGVLVQVQGSEAPEIIINSNVNFKAKKEYYNKAYDVNLELIAVKGIRITGFTYGNSFKDIQDDLFDTEEEEK